METHWFNEVHPVNKWEPANYRSIQVVVEQWTLWTQGELLNSLLNSLLDPQLDPLSDPLNSQAELQFTDEVRSTGPKVNKRKQLKFRSKVISGFY